MNATLETWTGLLLLHPWLMSLAVLLPLGWWARARTGARPALQFAPGALLRSRSLPGSWRTVLVRALTVLQACGLLLLLVALARPVHRAALPREVLGLDILLCLDRSSSMAAQDLGAGRTRLEVAQEAARRFVQGRPDDRIGLVAFARYPDVVCAPTLDHGAVLRALDEVTLVEVDDDEDRTALGAAVSEAARVLSELDGPAPLVVLLTDGEETVASPGATEEIDPVRAGRLCEALGVRTYAIAAGEGRRTRDGSFEPVDHAPLERLANLSGGHFFLARDQGALDDVYRTIGALETSPLGVTRYERQERFVPFLLSGLALLLLHQLVRSSVGEVRP